MTNTNNDELIKDGIRFRWLIDNALDYKPPDYDGLPYGRFDLLWKNEISCIRSAIDKEIENKQQ